jgi:hypothetical protein
MMPSRLAITTSYLKKCHCFLKETSNKDLSTLAKVAFELLKWRIFWDPHLQEAVSVILSSANDSNWRTRSATLTYLRTFMYRYGFGFVLLFYFCIAIFFFFGWGEVGG